MALSQSAVLELIKDRLYPMFTEERRRLAEIAKWAGSEHDPLDLPSGANQEQRNLRDLARTPWLSLVSAATTQALIVDGYRSPDQPDNAKPWDGWEANDLDAKQVGIHRATSDFGYCYAKAVPGEVAGESRAKFTPIDPRHALAVYADPVDDEWPMYVLHGVPTKTKWLLNLWEDEKQHIVSLGADGAEIEYVEFRDNTTGVVPFVRYAPQMDLLGRALGQVEPFIVVAKRMNKNTHDRLLAQHYNSWKIRYATGVDLGAGLAEPNAESTLEEWETYYAEIERRRLRLSQSEMLTARDHDTKFGTLDETPLDGFVRVDSADREALAAVSQTPTTTLATGDVANISADAITEIRHGWRQKVDLLKRGLGKSHAQLLRLGAHIDGDEAGASDFRARATWRDLEVVSISQAADAYGKIAQQLGVPPKALWRLLPGIEQADVDEWTAMVAEGDALAGLTTLLERQATQPEPPAPFTAPV